MKLFILLFLACTLHAADPFLSKPVASAKDTMEAAEIAYAEACAKAWADSNIKALPLPVLSKDPKDSERQALEYTRRINSRIVYMEVVFNAPTHGWNNAPKTLAASRHVREAVMDMSKEIAKAIANGTLKD
jgi:hypothetical protein